MPFRMPPCYYILVDFNRRQFEFFVAEALDSLPENFGRKLENVSVEVGLLPTRQDLLDAGVTVPGGSLFGLYRGFPRTKRDNYTAVLPDKIILFAGPLISFYGHDLRLLKRQIKNTLLHEIGHHFGMSEEEIRSAQKG